MIFVHLHVTVTNTRAHIPNAIFIGIDGGFAPWVGTLIGDTKHPILLITPGSIAAYKTPVVTTSSRFRKPLLPYSLVSYICLMRPKTSIKSNSTLTNLHILYLKTLLKINYLS